MTAANDVGGNVADLVTAAVRRGPRHPALIDGTSGMELTCEQLDVAVDREAHRLLGSGLVPGERVALRMGNNIAFCIALFGALRAGAVVVPLSPKLPTAELRRVLGDCGARWLVADENPFGASAPVAVLPAPDGGAAPITAEPVRARAGDEDIALISYTSGSSALSRGVMLSHRALLANAGQCGRLRPMPVNAADRALLALPMFHLYGLGPGLLQTVAVGATAVLLAGFDAEEALDVITRLRVTTVIGVPPMYHEWLRLPAERLREGMSTVRLLHSGAAPLGAEVALAVRAAAGLDVFEGYGMIEAGPVLATTLASNRAKPGSVGKPVPGVEIRLVDSDGTPLEEPRHNGSGADGTATEIGRVTARGDNLFSGYWPDGRQATGPDGWLATGDLGYFDEEGDLHLVDQTADLIAVEGVRVYPHEVEQVLLELPEVADAAVVGTPDEVRGEVVKAVLVPREGVELTRERVREHCLARLEEFKVPAVVDFVSALPHLPTGKLARRVLRRG